MLKSSPIERSLRVFPLLPIYGAQPYRWPVLITAQSDAQSRGALAPQIEAQGARVVSIEPAPADSSPRDEMTFFVWVEATGDTQRPSLTVALPELGLASVQTELPQGVDLGELQWELWRQGADVTLADITAAPPDGAGPWQPIQMPKGWQAAGVTWVRARLVIPQAWTGETLRLMMRSVSRADVAFLNGVEIGRTSAREAARCYELPQGAVRWGQENELAIAVEFPAPPTTVPQFRGVAGVRGAPIQLIAGDLPEACRLQAVYAPQPEAERASQGPIGQPQPLRPLVVRDGVLYYHDGGEVALWGENIYPQSWEEYEALKRLGIDPRQAVDDDLDDFAASGIEAIRIHVFDSEITDRQGNLVANEHLDVLDYIVAGCNRRGIYLWLTPIAWWGSPGARPDALSRHVAKQAMSMWPSAWQAEANYLRQFLSHVNPYTSNRLADEPCLALFEIMNEPWYWSFTEVMGAEPTFGGEAGIDAADLQECLAGVRQAWLDALPSESWRRQEVFLFWRYNTVRRYINAMREAIRSVGAAQPVAYSLFHSGYPRSDIELAAADSRCEFVTTWAYPGGLEVEPIFDRVNHLAGAGDTSLSARLAAKARAVYEFDAAGLAVSCYMYPALARRWRNIGVQVACQFQYDCTPLAHLNWAWETHYLNLRHTPEKWVSYLIAGEVFRRLPRGATFDTPMDNQVFGPAAVSFERNTSLLCAEDCYMQARPTDWRPLPLPSAPRRIVTVGTCPYLEYEGSGIVMFQDEGETATLRIYPDVERLAPSRLRGDVEHPLTQLREIERPFRLLLPGWQAARLERQEAAGWAPVAGVAGDFVARPGRYRLTRA